MAEYLDNNGELLKKGFYSPKRFDISNVLFYFTGNYNEQGVPEFNGIDRGEEKICLQAYLTRMLIPLPKDEIKKKSEELKAKASWIEKRLKE